MNTAQPTGKTPCQECKGTGTVSFLPKGAAPGDYQITQCRNPTCKNGFVCPDLQRRRRHQNQFFGIPFSQIPAHVLPDLE